MAILTQNEALVAIRLVSSADSVPAEITTIANVLFPAAVLRVEQYEPSAPEAAKNLAITRMLGYLWDLETTGRDAHFDPLLASGAKNILNPYKSKSAAVIRKAGATGSTGQVDTTPGEVTQSEFDALATRVTTAETELDQAETNISTNTQSLVNKANNASLAAKLNRNLDNVGTVSAENATAFRTAIGAGTGGGSGGGLNQAQVDARVEAGTKDLDAQVSELHNLTRDLHVVESYSWADNTDGAKGQFEANLSLPVANGNLVLETARENKPIIGWQEGGIIARLEENESRSHWRITFIGDGESYHIPASQWTPASATQITGQADGWNYFIVHTGLTPGPDVDYIALQTDQSAVVYDGEFADGTVNEDAIQDDSVSTNKLKDEAVTDAKRHKLHDVIRAFIPRNAFTINQHEPVWFFGSNSVEPTRNATPEIPIPSNSGNEYPQGMAISSVTSTAVNHPIDVLRFGEVSNLVVQGNITQHGSLPYPIYWMRTARTVSIDGSSYSTHWTVDQANASSPEVYGMFNSTSVSANTSGSIGSANFDFTGKALHQRANPADNTLRTLGLAGLAAANRNKFLKRKSDDTGFDYVDAPTGDGSSGTAPSLANVSSALGLAAPASANRGKFIQRKTDDTGYNYVDAPSGGGITVAYDSSSVAIINGTVDVSTTPSNWTLAIVQLRLAASGHIINTRLITKAEWDATSNGAIVILFFEPGESFGSVDYGRIRRKSATVMECNAGNSELVGKFITVDYI